MTDAVLPLAVTAHAAATWFMVGLIWFVQVVHYPLFAAVGQQGWNAYSRRHQSLTTLVVGPAMLIEATSAAVLLALVPSALTATNAFMLALIWASTFFVQVPLHGRLSNGHNADVMRKLVVTNWVRTILWSVRGGLALILLSSS